MPYTITREDAELDLAALKTAVASPDHMQGPKGAILRGLIAQIEEQVKPAVAEPTAFGSIVSARYRDQPKGSESFLWQQAPDLGDHYWRTRNNAVEVWSELTDVEVLRAGVGDGSIADQKAAYLSGRRDFAGAVQRELTTLEGGVLTFPEQRCYKDARAMVARLLGES